MNTNLLYKAARLLPDRLFLDLKYYKNFHKFPNWRHPQTFNEKLNWLKLHDHNPLYTTLVDKYLVKNYVANIIGQEYIIPTLGAWDRAEDIDFDSLPNQFVLKANHESGHVVICKDKNLLDKEQTIREMKAALQRDFYAETREWPYKNVKRKVIAEKYMKEGDPSSNDPLTDYKFYCFDGQPIYCQVIRNRTTQETIDFYDLDWQHQSFIGLNPKAQHAPLPIAKPLQLQQMIAICKTLSEHLHFVRIDLYDINQQVYFGEMTFYPNSGVGFFQPESWNLTLGQMIQLKS